MAIKHFLMTVLFLGLVSTGYAQDTLPVETVGGVALPGVAAGVTDKGKKTPVEASTARKVANIDQALYTDTRVGLMVDPGTTEVIPIARNFLNRIITPFENPKLITVNDIQFKKEGSSLFLTTASEAPVGIHILSNDPGDTRSISLALVPKAIPPRTLHLKWPGQGQGVLVPGQARASLVKAERWEQSSPYVETLMELFSLVARGEVPPGYALEQSPADLPCAMPGVSVFVGQRLVGNHFSVYVLRATNKGAQTVEIVQTAGCRANGVIAVAPWPNAYLQPGDSTEVYVAVANNEYEVSQQPNLRPSLLQY